MKTKELRKKNVKTLQVELTNLLRERFNLNVQAASSRLKKSHLIKKVRREIARIKTLLTEKQ